MPHHRAGGSAELERSESCVRVVPFEVAVTSRSRATAFDAVGRRNYTILRSWWPCRVCLTLGFEPLISDVRMLYSEWSRGP